MRVELEPELLVLGETSANDGLPVRSEDEQSFGGLLRTACDLSGTPFSAYGQDLPEPAPAEPPAVIAPPDPIKPVARANSA
ncbi:MAG: hypothetical protein CGU28_17250, partial [Candidatus Dactylopiibacterium carminicum]